jgi:hypothetical protein
VPAPTQKQPAANGKDTATVPTKVGSGPGNGIIRVDCPACRTPGAVRWDKIGRLHICRHCSRSFRVDRQHGVVEVIQNRDGKWVDKHVHEESSRRKKLTRFALGRLLPATVLAAAVLLVVWFRFFNAPAALAEVELPHELEPRVELFTRAWLKKDWAQMRLFVTPGEEKRLYKWSVRNPPPGSKVKAAAADDLKIQVLVASPHAIKSGVTARIQGAPGAKTGTGLELPQFWEKHGDAWVFVVPNL